MNSNTQVLVQSHKPEFLFFSGRNYKCIGSNVMFPLCYKALRMETNSSLANPRKDVVIVTRPVLCVSKSLDTKSSSFISSLLNSELYCKLYAFHANNVLLAIVWQKCAPACSICFCSGDIFLIYIIFYGYLWYYLITLSCAYINLQLDY